MERHLFINADAFLVHLVLAVAPDVEGQWQEPTQRHRWRVLIKHKPARPMLPRRIGEGGRHRTARRSTVHKWIRTIRLACIISGGIERWSTLGNGETAG